MKAVLKISEHAPYPGTQFAKDSEYSGEWFRQEILLPFINTHHPHLININMDGVPGYTIGFLKVAFIGLGNHINEFTHTQPHFKIFQQIAESWANTPIALGREQASRACLPPFINPQKNILHIFTHYSQLYI